MLLTAVLAGKTSFKGDFAVFFVHWTPQMMKGPFFIMNVVVSIYCFIYSHDYTWFKSISKNPKTRRSLPPGFADYRLPIIFFVDKINWFFLYCCTDLKKCCPQMYAAYTKSVEEQSISGIYLLFLKHPPVHAIPKILLFFAYNFLHWQYKLVLFALMKMSQKMLSRNVCSIYQKCRGTEYFGNNATFF